MTCHRWPQMAGHLADFARQPFGDARALAGGCFGNQLWQLMRAVQQQPQRATDHAGAGQPGAASREHGPAPQHGCPLRRKRAPFRAHQRIHQYQTRHQFRPQLLEPPHQQASKRMPHQNERPFCVTRAEYCFQIRHSVRAIRVAAPAESGAVISNHGGVARQQWRHQRPAH